jgi:hypothetical protein
VKAFQEEFEQVRFTASLLPAYPMGRETVQALQLGAEIQGPISGRAPDRGRSITTCSSSMLWTPS